MKKITLLTLIFFLILSAVALGQFIRDDDDQIDIIFRDQKKDHARAPLNGRYPKWLPFNIEAYKSTEVPSTVVVRWEADESYSGDFVVGRSNTKLDSVDKVLSASTVRILPASMRGLVVDGPLPPGTYYYVVVPKRYLFKRNIELYRGMNYTVVPVIITEKDAKAAPVHVKGIQVEDAGRNRVKITWKEPHSRNYGYVIYRHHDVLDRGDAFKKAQRRGMVIDKNSYIDHIPGDGIYYYAVVTIKGGKELFYMIPQENFTLSPYVQGDRKVIDRIEVLRLIGARTKGGVILKWIHGGTRGTRDFIIFSSGERFCSPEEVTKSRIIATVRVEKGIYFIPKASKKRQWYGLLPAKTRDSSCHLIPGKNLVFIDAAETSETSSPEQKVLLRRQPEAKKESSVKKHVSPEQKSISPEQKPQRRDKVPEKRRLQKEKVGSKGIHTRRKLDIILHRTFFIGKYTESIEELEEFIKISDNNKEKSKAYLFLARSYIEKEQYRKALILLEKENVARDFPVEQSFWRAYVTRKLNR
jgi:hypothetical protein